MSSRFVGAVLVGLALSAAPIISSAAQGPAAPAAAATPASLQSSIANAARATAADASFAAMTPEAKLTAIQIAVSEALTLSGAAPEAIADALIAAVEGNVISAGVAISVANTVAPSMSKKVASARVVVAKLNAAGATASTNGDGSVSILTSLGGPAGAGAAAPYDPCAGVIADYCGT